MGLKKEIMTETQLLVFYIGCWQIGDWLSDILRYLIG
jgi:hypothetical protein